VALADLYVLAPIRSAELVTRFLEHFLPKRKPAADDYPVPEYSDSPELVLKTAEEVSRYCELHPNAAQCVYWNHPDSSDEPSSAYCFFLADGGLILGLSVSENSLIRDCLLDRMLTFLGSRIGYATVEEAPPDTTQAFQEIAACRWGAKQPS
jgi:hypothetical protein